MSLSFSQKKAVVEDASAALEGAQAAIIAEYRGLSVSKLTELRKNAREANVWVKVVKNNLAKRAVADSDFACLSDAFVGPVLFSVSEDPVAVAKVMDNFAKDNDLFKITAGAMNGTELGLDEIKALAKLPGREELLAKLLGTMQAPIQKTAATLNEIPTKFVRALAAVRDAKSEG